MQQTRLRAFVMIDTASGVIGAAAMVLVYFTVSPSRSLLIAVAVIGSASAIMASALIPLRKGDARTTVAVLALANWWAALGATTVATFAWPLLVTASLIPAMLAGPYLAHRRVQQFVAISLAVSLAVAALGLLQDVTGMSQDLPQWIRQGVLITFTPFLSGMVVLLALQSSHYRQTLLNDLIKSRARIVVASDRERQRIERDIHDGAQQRLVALALRMSEAKQLVPTNPSKAIEVLDLLRKELHSAQAELRDLAQGVYPPVLTEHGLPAALESIAGHAPLSVTLRTDQIGRYTPDIEAAIYFCCAEAVQNAYRHAGPEVETSIDVHQINSGWLRFVVSDNGRGITATNRGCGRGIQNMHDRMGAIGGHLSIDRLDDGGTRVRGDVPTH